MSLIPLPPAYEANEMKMFHKQLDALEHAPLAERKAAAAEWADALRNHPQTIAERIGWLLNGDYGYGSYVQARRIASSPRMNRVAALSGLVAALEWMTPSSMAVGEWKKLTAAQKARVKRLIESGIKAWERSEEAERAYQEKRR